MKIVISDQCLCGEKEKNTKYGEAFEVLGLRSLEAQMNS